MKFLQKVRLKIYLGYFDFDIAFTAGVIWSTTILWLTVDEAYDYFYIEHLITCVAAYILANTLSKLIYFVCAKIKRIK